MKKILAVALILGASGVFADPITDKYNKSCAVCHASGAAGAPVAHDTTAWEPRLAKGLDALVVSATNGLNAMPPKGMCFDCSADDYKALIGFMSKPAE